MLDRFVAACVAWCVRHAKSLVAAILLLAVVAGFYTATHLKMDTNTANMIAPDLPWRQEQLRLDALFPQNNGLLVVMVEGKTPDAAEDATAALYQKLSERKDLFISVRRPDGGAFFQRYGMLFLKKEELQKIAASVIDAQAFIGSLAADPSLRGLFNVLNLALDGVAAHAIAIDKIEKPLSAIASTLNRSFLGDRQPLSWQSLLFDRPVRPSDLRHMILTQPVRDFHALQSGARASAFIRQAAEDLHLTAETGVTVRLTGPVALADDEFSTVAEGMGLALVLSTLIVLGLLFMALRSIKLILATFITLTIGLVLTFAFAALAVGTLNLISIAFAVMFIGISIDFGIQFGVRYGEERRAKDGNAVALSRTGAVMAKPLIIAALAIAAGFASFIPTDYKGVSELGIIAIAGMAITIILNLTLLPALLALLKPVTRAQRNPPRLSNKPDMFLIMHRRKILFAWACVALAGAALAPRLHFDFNPLHLKDQKAESVAAVIDMMQDPLHTPYSIEILAPNIAEAQTLAQKLGGLPEVHAAITAASFIPADQEEKLTILDDLSLLIGPSLHAEGGTKAPPSIDEIRAAMRACAEKLAAAAPSSDIAQQLARLLDQAVNADAGMYPILQQMLVDGLTPRLNALATALTAGPVDLAHLPDEIRRDWIAADGAAKIMVIPAGDSNDNAVLTQFVKAVRALAPQANGPAVQIYEAGRAVSNAFLIATLAAFVAINCLLLAILRRWRDVMLVFLPLLVAGLTVAGICAVSGFAFNFANIIALPLLLGIGVAFNIYFAVNWRRGVAMPLQTSTARAVLFSALTTAASFGSLALSRHPGTAGMGFLLLISLFVVLAATFTFMPSLMGPPPKDASAGDGNGRKRN